MRIDNDDSISTVWKIVCVSNANMTIIDGDL